MSGGGGGGTTFGGDNIHYYTVIGLLHIEWSSQHHSVQCALHRKSGVCGQCRPQLF